MPSPFLGLNAMSHSGAFAGEFDGAFGDSGELCFSDDFRGTPLASGTGAGCRVMDMRFEELHQQQIEELHRQLFEELHRQ